MDFVPDNFAAIGEALQNRQDIEFDVPLDATPYAGSDAAPATWQQCRPAGSADDLKRLLSKTTTTTSGIAAAVSLIVERDGGVIHYRSANDGKVSMRVTWPRDA